MSDVNVLFICLGNICRSPLAEGVMRHKLAEAGLDRWVGVDSCGTSAYHVGEAPDPGSVAVARRRGIDISGLRARALDPLDPQRFDWLVCMDRSNLAHVRRLAPDHPGVVLLRDFEPGPGRGEDVPDPWGGGASGFERVYEMVDRCTAALAATLRADAASRPGGVR